MGDVLMIAQIEARFTSEWVLVEDPETNQALEVQRGKVRWHSKDREEVYRKAVELRPKRFAVLYTGRMPEDTAIVLGVSISTPNVGWSSSGLNYRDLQEVLSCGSRWTREPRALAIWRQFHVTKYSMP